MAKGINKEALLVMSEFARMRQNEAARLIRRSAQMTGYILDSFKKQEILRDAYAIIDPSYFGLARFQVYFKGAYVTEKDKEQTINDLRNNEYINAIYELEGEYDLVIEICAPNASRFNKALLSIIAGNPKLSDYKVGLSIVSHIYPRMYLTKSKKIGSKMYNEMIIGGDRQTADLSKDELNIIRTIAQYPNEGLLKISSIADVNIRTAKKIINSLESRKILRGYQYLIDIEKVPILRKRVMIKLHNLSSRQEEKLMVYLADVDEIVYATKTISDWDIEIDIESFEAKRIRKIILDMKETFKDIIQSFNMIDFHQYYLRDFLPKYIIEPTKKAKKPALTS